MKELRSEGRELRWEDRSLRLTSQRRLLLDREGKLPGCRLRGEKRRIERGILLGRPGYERDKRRKGGELRGNEGRREMGGSKWKEEGERARWTYFSCSLLLFGEKS